MLKHLALGALLISFCPVILAAKSSKIYDYELAGFDEKNYELSVNTLVNDFEKVKKIAPGETGRIALRVYTYSGPGLCTPRNLVLALCKYLEGCGFKRENILVVGDSKDSLQECGYLPKLSKQASEGLMFHNMPVFWIDDEKFHDKRWVYTNSLASNKILLHSNFWLDRGPNGVNNLRDSYLPTLLMFGVDSWIDMPVYIGSFEHGVIGSLIHSSIFNVSNNKRFLSNPTNCASAAAQIAAVPELKNRYLFTVTSLEHFQYCDSLIYDENYTCSLPHVLLSADPVALDCLCLKILNCTKSLYNFRYMRDQPMLFRYASELDVGQTQFKIVKAKRKRQ